MIYHLDIIKLFSSLHNTYCNLRYVNMAAFGKVQVAAHNFGCASATCGKLVHSSDDQVRSEQKSMKNDRRRAKEM